MKLAGLKSIENAHDESIWAVSWIPATSDRPSLLLTGSLDETVRLWRPDDLSPAGPASSGHSLGVVSSAAHPAGGLAASASLDSFIRVFDVESNSSIATFEAPPSEVWNMQFDPKVFDETVRFARSWTLSLLILVFDEAVRFVRSWTLSLLILGFVVVETNFRMYAYSTSKLYCEILRLFSRPNRHENINWRWRTKHRSTPVSPLTTVDGDDDGDSFVQFSLSSVLFNCISLSLESIEAAHFLSLISLQLTRNSQS